MRRYHVTTFGCQMNAHDARAHQGAARVRRAWARRTEPDDADVLVFNTCTIREKADDRFVSPPHERARAAKERDPGEVIVVGGCWSESMKDRLFDQYPFVDLAFGPGNIHRLGDFVQAGGAVPRGHFSTFDDFAGDLPHAPRPAVPGLAADLAWAATRACSYCIVPSVRGRERSRPADAIWPRSSAWPPTACAS